MLRLMGKPGVLIFICSGGWRALRQEYRLTNLSVIRRGQEGSTSTRTLRNYQKRSLAAVNISTVFIVISIHSLVVLGTKVITYSAQLGGQKSGHQVEGFFNLNGDPNFAHKITGNFAMFSFEPGKSSNNILWDSCGCI